MEVLWKGDEYEFEPRTLQGGGDNYTRYSNINGCIFGADTESVKLPDRYEPQCFTSSDPWGGDDLVYIPEMIPALKYYLFWFLGKYFEDLVERGSHHFIYFHNLEYDWLQLVKYDERLLEMARIGVSPGEDVELFRENGFRIKLKKNALFAGSAPHVKLRISKGSKKQEKAITLYIYDTFSFFPTSLAKLAIDLELGFKKMDRQENLGEIDYRTIPDDDPDKQYFEEYAKMDSRATQAAGEKIRELHRSAGMTKIRPSAPSYAIALLFHCLEETQAIKTGVHDQAIMQLILDSYRGGRTGGIVHGKVNNVCVLDFHSSYPGSMLSLPSFSPEMQYVRLEGEELELDNVLAILEETGNAFLKISGVETDPRYPSLLTTHNGKLTPIYGKFENVATTGYEFFVGIKSGGLKNIVIHECIVLLDMDDDPFLPFKVFAETNYKLKAKEKKGSVLYAKAKLALNAAYGKLIESLFQTMIGISQGRDYLPYIEGMEKDFGNYYYGEYTKMLESGEPYEEWYSRILEEVENNFPDEYDKMNTKMFSDFSISGKVYGRYATPAAASLITGCSRARLLVAMKLLQADYWDTDSVFVRGLSGDVTETNLILAPGLLWLPGNAVPVQVGDELGELDFEMIGGSGYLAGTKRYYLTDTEGNQKRATHGLPALPFEKVPDVIAALATGKNYSYLSKERPMKAKESKNANEIGSFRAGNYTSEFHLDERLEWQQTETGWIGTVRNFQEMGVTELSEADYQKYLEKLFKTELSYDYIKEGIAKEGYIQVIQKTDLYYGEYKDIPADRKRKYFRKSGVPIDVWATNLNIELNELLERLRTI